MTKPTNKQGQILLIAVMLLATVITVVMTIAFNATNDTKLVKLEEDSQKALAAAEAGIDAVIRQSVNSTVNINSLGQFSSQGISGNAQVSTDLKPTFVSPLLQKDEQYTFYLSDYPSFANPKTEDLNLYFVSEAGQCPSIEVTVISGPTTNPTQTRSAFNTCGSATINNAVTASNVSTEIDTVSFQWKTQLPIVNGVVAFVKVYGGKTKLGFTFESGATLPSQGKLIESEARTASGVVKRVQLFQSYPQIPSNFLMTSF